MPLQELITPENLPAIMTAFGGILGGGGIITLIKVRREPPKPGTPDAAAVAMVDLTKAMQEMVAAMRGQNDHFSDNNEMFKALGPVLSGMARDFAEVRHDTAENKANLAAIRDALNRRR